MTDCCLDVAPGVGHEVIVGGSEALLSQLLDDATVVIIGGCWEWTLAFARTILEEGKGDLIARVQDRDAYVVLTVGATRADVANVVRTICLNSECRYPEFVAGDDSMLFGAFDECRT